MTVLKTTSYVLKILCSNARPVIRHCLNFLACQLRSARTDSQVTEPVADHLTGYLFAKRVQVAIYGIDHHINPSFPRFTVLRSANEVVHYRGIAAVSDGERWGCCFLRRRVPLQCCWRARRGRCRRCRGRLSARATAPPPSKPRWGSSQTNFKSTGPGTRPAPHPALSLGASLRLGCN